MKQRNRAMAPDVLVVDEHVARNPLAQAVAKARQIQSARDFGIRLYLLQDGEDALSDGVAAARVVRLALILCEQRGAPLSAEARVLAGAVSTLLGLAQRRWAWRCMDAAAIDTGLQRAIEEVQRSSAAQMAKAWQQLLTEEARAASGLEAQAS